MHNFYTINFHFIETIITMLYLIVCTQMEQRVFWGKGFTVDV